MICWPGKAISERLGWKMDNDNLITSGAAAGIRGFNRAAIEQSNTVHHLEQISRLCPTPVGWTYNSIEQFVLRNGRRFSRAELPQGVRLGASKTCFRNSIRLAKSRGLLYVEGYARWGERPIPMLHAWCADSDGNAFDPTWPDGIEYFGVAIDLDYAIQRRKASGWESVIDSPPEFPIVSGRDKGWEALLAGRAAVAVSPFPVSSV